MQRLVGAVGAVVVAAVVNVATGFLTDHRAATWWVSSVVLLVVGVLVQWWLPVVSQPSTIRRQTADDNRVGGSFVQRTDGPAEQEARRNDIAGGFSQSQDG
ncbi:hypothetical protein [Embleya sp. NPDC020886]|uniref:hypothetical protein n=1 Tax=Embleya sp. NPDC020886 TaxID=3363980 RepID=UPI003798DF15